MTNSSPSFSSDAKRQDDPSAGFKDCNEALRALRTMQSPIGGDAREGFIQKTTRSALARPIAFAVLAQGWGDASDARWTVVRQPLRSLLLGTEPYPSPDQLADVAGRRLWLSDEFGTDHRVQSAKDFVERFGYLRPLYILLSAPDNEPWICDALADYLNELEDALAVSKGKAGAKRSAGRSSSPPGIRLAAILTRQLPTKGDSPRALLASLRVIEAIGRIQTWQSAETNELRRQVQSLQRLLEEKRSELDRAVAALDEARRKISETEADAGALRHELLRLSHDAQIQKGAAASNLQEQLNAQRAALRSVMRDKLQNVRLYADRSDPARDKIIRLCDEMLQHLDSNPS